jgi:hypothetical protein
VIIEKDYVLLIREGQLLYINFIVMIFATGHIYLANISVKQRLEFLRITVPQKQVHLRLSLGSVHGS